jgi:GT2 family glycosyltransferase
MINPEKVSIIIPTLNCHDYLVFCLESIRALQQSGAELIIVDSYSKDGTAELGKDKADSFLEVPAGNMYEAINAGMRAANGAWLSYVNADDILFAGTILKVLKTVSPETDLFYGGSLDYIDGENRFLHSFTMPPPQDLVPLACKLVNSVPPQGAFFRREVFETLNGFDNENFRLAGDFDFFIRAKLAGFNFHRFERPALAAFRMHAGQYSQQRDIELKQESQRSVEINNLSPNRITILKAFARFKLRNLCNYLMRFLRARQLTGKFSLRGSLDY